MKPYDAMFRQIREWREVRRLPQTAREVLARDRSGFRGEDPGAQHAVAAGLDWIARAQDCSRTSDGGVARHFSLVDGWGASYPETTGYIIPTLIEQGRLTDRADLMDRAKRMLDWLLAIQFPDGGFQGGMVDQLPRVPVTFNTGQILIGLAAGARLDQRYREAMIRAADWLVATQDRDGCWRSHPTPFAQPGEKTYETHVALGLIHAHEIESARGYLDAGLRQVEWALNNQSSNGWLAKCCLTDPTQPLTHTLGYALRGFIGAYQATKNANILEGILKMARGLLPAIGSDGFLPGRLDSNWRGTVEWSCLTGSCQIAESFLLFQHHLPQPQLLQAAKALNAYVRRTLILDGNRDIVGGVKGSFPVNGQYGKWQYLNWACKFMIDANSAELSVV